MKILVTIVDGMRPDALVKTENAKYILEAWFQGRKH